MKIRLKINGQNRFSAYEIRREELICIGQFAGSIATVRRLITAKLGHQVEIERKNKEGWY